MIKVAVIDDGIHEGLYQAGMLLDNIEVNPELEVRQRVGYDPLLPSHGTTCAAVIQKYLPDARFASIKILNDDSRKGMKSQLVKALEWCVNEGIHLVNLSLGTIDYRDFEELSRAVKQAREKGVVIVAACNNRNINTCPASLPDVIGVRCDISGNLKEGEYVWNSFAPDGIEITACGSHYLTKYNGEEKTTNPCNSFAAPMMTAIVYEIMKNNPGILLEDIKAELKKHAVNKEVKVYTEVAKMEVNVPIIIIYDGITGKAPDIAGKLAGLFQKDGYNAVAVTDKDGETESDVKSLADYCKEGVYDITDELWNLYSVFDSDLIILGLDSFDKMEELERTYEIDIKVMVTNSDVSQLRKIVKNNGQSKLIALTNNNFDKRTDFPGAEITWLEYAGAEFLIELYNHIINLYECFEAI